MIWQAHDAAVAQIERCLPDAVMEKYVELCESLEDMVRSELFTRFVVVAIIMNAFFSIITEQISMSKV